MGEPLQLIKFVKDNSSPQKDATTIEICEENLRRVLASVGNSPLCIIAICGPSRQGKSFILGHMIRCLTALEKDDPNWMDWANPKTPLTGFEWQNSTDPVTKGIWVWSKPFHVKNDEGDNITVLLIDTQGTYDEFTTTRDMTAIVGLSLLMSSIMIFNFFHNLQEDILNSLSSYVEFGLLALENSKHHKVTTTPFQKLIFLIRDWNNPADFPYGWDGGNGFIKTKLEVKQDQPKESQELRNKLKKCFESMDCFLMPTIGEKGKLPDYDGNIGDLSQVFATRLEEFVSRLMTSELVEKAILGNTISKENFLTYLSEYVKVFNGSDVPSPVSMMEATQFVVNSKAVENAVKKYQTEVKKYQMKYKYLTKEKMKETHASSKIESLKFFKASKKLGDKPITKKYEGELVHKIDEQFAIIQQQNESKRERLIKIAEKEACNKLETSMELEFPFPNGLTFYEAAVIRENSTFFKTTYLSEFKGGLDEKDEEEVSLILEALEYHFNKILEKIKNKNEENLRRATKEMEGIVDDLQIEYEARINAAANDDFVETIKELEERSKSLSEVIMKAFLEMQKPGNRNFQQKFEKDLATKISSFFNSGVRPRFEKKLESMKVETRELIWKLKTEYEDSLKNDIENDLEEDISIEEVAAKVNLICQENLNSSLNQFRTASPYANGTKRLEATENELKSELETLRKQCQSEVLKRRWLTEDSYNVAIEQSCKFYSDNMRPLVEQLLEEEELEAEHETWMKNSLEIYNRVDKSNKSNRREEERYISKLTSKLKSHFANLLTESKQNYKSATIKLQNIVSDCIKFYGQKLQTKTLDLSKNGIDDDDLRNATRSQFEMACKEVNNMKMRKIYEKTLETELETTFAQFEEFAKLKQCDERDRLKTAINSIREVYKEEMEKQLLKNIGFLEPQMLQKLHHTALNVAWKVKEDDASQLTKTQQGQVEKILENVFASFAMDNDMKLNSDKTLTDPAIGIDLGTTYCCVAVYFDNKVRIIPSITGSNITASYVGYTEHGNLLVGEAAKDLSHKNPENTIFDTKRIIGRRMTDAKLQDDMLHWPFSIVDVDGIPKLEVYGKTYHPEQVSASLLKSLKDEAEKFVKCKIKKAVITVPAYFSDGQRQATVDAGVIAGFEVMDILNEPTAAAIAYKLERMDEEARNILVYDLGGGTFDVAVLEIKEGNIEVLGVDGDTHLGGEDFDRNLMKYCVEKFLQDFGIDLFVGLTTAVKKTKDEYQSAIRRLQSYCEKAKTHLSSAAEVTVSVTQIFGQDLKVEVSREKFEELNQHLFEKTLEIMERALGVSNIRKEDINDIVLIGGSTRIPKIQQLLRNFFGGKALNHTINPDEAVAYGAAVHAAIKNGIEAKTHFKFDQIRDVTPMSYGVAVMGGLMSVVIPKNSKIPANFSQDYYTQYDNMTEQQFCIYQGEDPHISNNILLGSFILRDIPPASRGKDAMPVDMRIDGMGILQVTATSSSTGKSTSITLVADKGRLTEDEKLRLIKDGNDFHHNTEEETVSLEDGASDSDGFDAYCEGEEYDDEEGSDIDL